MTPAMSRRCGGGCYPARRAGAGVARRRDGVGATCAPGHFRSIVCAKGIEQGTRRFMTEVIAEAMPSAVPAILSGPSFAADVARGLPTAVTLATADDRTAAALAARVGLA